MKRNYFSTSGMGKKLTLIFAILFMSITFSFACGIDFVLTDKSGKEVKPEHVKNGETYTLVLTYRYTHGNCGVDLKDTDYKTDGIKILKATEWKKENNVYVRKMQIRIVDNKKDAVSLNVIRSCNRAGLNATFPLSR